MGPAAEGLVAELLRAGSAVRFAATGHSMTPAIRSGDQLEVEPLWARPRIGDVLVYESGRRLLVHRLVRREGGFDVCRGDASPQTDSPITDAAVLGVVSGIERGGRPVRLGLGRERLLIAWLSGRGLLQAALRWRARLRPRSRGASVSPGREFRLRSS